MSAFIAYISKEENSVGYTAAATDANWEKVNQYAKEALSDGNYVHLMKYENLMNKNTYSKKFTVDPKQYETCEDKRTVLNALCYDDYLEAMQTFCPGQTITKVAAEPVFDNTENTDIVGRYEILERDILDFIPMVKTENTQDIDFGKCKLFAEVHENGNVTVSVAEDGKAVYPVDISEDRSLDDLVFMLEKATGADNAMELIGNTAAKYPFDFDKAVFQNVKVQGNTVSCDMVLHERDAVYALEQSSLMLENPYQTASEWIQNAEVSFSVQKTDTSLQIVVHMDKEQGVLTLSEEEKAVISEKLTEITPKKDKEIKVEK